MIIIFFQSNLRNNYLLDFRRNSVQNFVSHRFQKSGDWDTVQAGTPPGRDHPMGGWLQRLCPRSVAVVARMSLRQGPSDKDKRDRLRLQQARQQERG